MSGDAHTQKTSQHTQEHVLFSRTHTRESHWCLHAKKIIRRKEKYVQKTIKFFSKKDVQV
jgi:hypothetical protein